MNFMANQALEFVLIVYFDRVDTFATNRFATWQNSWPQIGQIHFTLAIQAVQVVVDFIQFVKHLRNVSCFITKTM